MGGNHAAPLFVLRVMHGSKGISESEFYMWRAVFAFTFVDNSLSLEEQELLQSYLQKVPFSKDQLETLKNDMRNPGKDVVGFYRKITSPEDKKRFCVLARAIVWCEGDMAAQERAILKKVSCLSEPEEEEIFHSTRNHPRISTYYQDYAKSGMVGLFKTPHSLEIHV